jgi:hypothetical protein
MAQLQGEHLRPHAPAVRVSDGHRHLKVRPKMFPHRLVLAPLEEARTGRRLPELWDQGEPQELPILVRESEHLIEDREIPVHRAVRGIL